MTEEDYKIIEEEVLRTLSFFDALNKERIILGFEKDFLDLYPEFSNEDLEDILKRLKKKRIITVKKEENGEITYLKRAPKRSLWRRFKSLFS